MAKYEYSSVFADEIRNYISEKIASGFKIKKIKNTLDKFDKFCNDEGLKKPEFTTVMAKKWLKKREDEADTTHYSRINTSKHLLKYLFMKGYNVYVVRDIRFKPTSFKPYIYSVEETERYFLAVDSISSRTNQKDAIQYPVLFRILYCCGTRIGETLSIRKKDVDLQKGILMLDETKNGQQRYIVVGDDLRVLLNTFAEKCFYMIKDDDYIFSNVHGKRLDPDVVYEHHRLFLLKAGIPYLGDGYGPRIHDWRHHMAVYSFKQLADSGLDMYAALPVLSTYLGHKTIFATEHYVRLTMELFPYIEERFRKRVDQIFGNFGGGALDEND